MGGQAERGRWTLVAVCATTFMLLVDITIVNVALPNGQRQLHASLTGLQWVVDAYAVSLAALILTAGALADRFGRRLVFAVGIVLFTAASFLCGVAWNVAALDVARALQGIGGAALFATALALIGLPDHARRPKRRVRHEDRQRRLPPPPRMRRLISGRSKPTTPSARSEPGLGSERQRTRSLQLRPQGARSSAR